MQHCEASGLRVNVAKTFAHLIRCSEAQGVEVGRELGCAVKTFPCTYLGLPLGLRKPSAPQLQFLVDKVANKLQTWSAPMLSSGGRLVLIKSTLSAMPIYAMFSLDIPAKVVGGIDKICRGFLWRGWKEARGGHCLVAWDRVCSSVEFGGLGLPNLRLLNIALRARWCWLRKVKPRTGLG